MGDPARTLALLWRHEVPLPARRGPRPRFSVDDVVDAATALADADGLEALTMRSVAERLGVSAMGLYSYVPGKDELLDLMLDAAHLAMPRPPWRGGQGWRERVAAVADANRALFAAHPWAAWVSSARPPLGPGTTAKYDHELAAFDGTGLADVELDAALTFVLGFVRGVARAGESEPEQDAAWWAESGPLLAQVLDVDRYPRAVRVGAAAGEAQGAAYDPGAAYRFGIERVLDGLEALVARGS